MGLDKKSVLNETMKLAPVIEKYDSDILKELAGVANGSGASLEEIMAINSRYELIWLKEVEYKERKECTSCGVLPESTSSHHTLIGENWDVKPDMIVMAKAIASGLPLGALLAKKELMETWDLGAHGTTFGGNHLSCAAGLASLDLIIENELAKNAEKIGNHILNRLKDMAEEHRLIGGVRGKGLMIGAELVKDRKTKEPAIEEMKQLIIESVKRGLLVISCGESTIRIASSLAIPEELVDKGLDILDVALNTVEQSL